MKKKRDDFDFDIVNFPFLDGDVPRSTSYSVIFLNLFDLLDCPVKLRPLNFSGKDIDIINFVRRFHKFIGGISTYCALI